MSDTFQHLTLPDGTEVCAADPPTEVTWLRDGSRAACGMQCLVRPACEVFNIRQTTDGTVQCQLYNYQPTNVSAVAGCVVYVNPVKPGMPLLKNVVMVSFCPTG